MVHEPARPCSPFSALDEYWNRPRSCGLLCPTPCLSHHYICCRVAGRSPVSTHARRAAFQGTLCSGRCCQGSSIRCYNSYPRCAPECHPALDTVRLGLGHHHRCERLRAHQQSSGARSQKCGRRTVCRTPDTRTSGCPRLSPRSRYRENYGTGPRPGGTGSGPCLWRLEKRSWRSEIHWH